MVSDAITLNAATTKMKLKMTNVAHFSARFVWVISLFLSDRVRTVQSNALASSFVRMASAANASEMPGAKPNS